jgi:MATE family multidrug resistance protein
MHWNQYKKHAKNYLSLSYTLVLNSLIARLIPLFSGLIIAQLGAVHLVAVSLGNSVFLIFYLLLKGISYGLTPLIAEAQTKKLKTEIGQLLKHALVLNFILSILLIIILLAVCFCLLPYLKQDKEVIVLTSSYLYLIAFSLLPVSMFTIFSRYLEGLSKTKPLIVIPILNVAITTMLNYVFIYGKCNVPTLGVCGVALAQLLSYVLVTMILGSYIFLSPKVSPYIKKSDLWNLNYLYILRLFKLGIPIAIQFVLEVAAFAVINMMAGWHGVDSQAACSMVYAIVNIGYAVNGGLSVATSILVAKQFGLKNIQVMKEVGTANFIIGGIIAGVLSVIFICNCSVVFGSYKPSSVVFNMASALVTAVVVLNIINVFYSISMCALRGRQDVLIPTNIANLGNWLIGVPLSYLLAFKLHWGIEGLLWGNVMAFLIPTIFFMLRFYLKDPKSTAMESQVK